MISTNLKNLLKQNKTFSKICLPPIRFFRRNLGILYARFLSVFNKKHYCNVCQSHIPFFKPWQHRYRQIIKDLSEEYSIIGSDIENFSCPICGTHDRVRHIFALFDKNNIWDSLKNKRILHVAPEADIKKALKINSCYYGCDIDPRKYGEDIIEVDITNICFKDKYFDFIICNHVLEHVYDLPVALNEIYRVLKEGGRALVQTPYSSTLSITIEDFSITDELERVRKFGQEDHLRLFGQDFFSKLKAAGFELNIINSKGIFSDDEAKYYGFNNNENFIFVIKPTCLIDY